MILVDTSVWVDHLRSRNGRLAKLLSDGLVACHPFIIAELALGYLHRRGEVLTLLAALPRVNQAEHEEVLSFVDSRRIHGCGVGWIDVHLLCAAAIHGLKFWTIDRRLAALAVRFGLSGQSGFAS